MVFSNVVRKDELRKIQLKALREISEALLCSFGPMGSNTLITKDGACNRYTKDGYSILKEITLSGVIEHSITEDLVDITRNIVKKFGDNTTCAILMSYLLFKEFTEKFEDKGILPFDIIDNFKKAVDVLAKEIEKSGRPCTIDDIYDIAYTSTNGNSNIALQIKTIYQQYGMDVFVDVAVSPTGEDLIKEYDGMTIDSGYSDSAYVNNKNKGTCSLRNPKIYVFQDPVDTPEMMAYFDSIIAQNIMGPMNDHRFEDVVPTVIMATKISRDLSAYIEQLINYMYQAPNGNKPPILIINDIHQEEQMLDICKLTGAKLICKYINAKQQQIDIEKGLCPTPLTVVSFGGTAEEVEASVVRTIFKNPADKYTRVLKDEAVAREVERIASIRSKTDNLSAGNILYMKDELVPEYTDDDYTIEYSDAYLSLTQFLEGTITAAIEDGKDANYIGSLKRRLNAIKGNMVEMLVGGVSVSDRDSVRDLVEDAVLNCRSASTYGVGYGANFEGLYACTKYTDPYIVSIRNAYMEVTKTLYHTVYKDEKFCDELVIKSLRDTTTGLKNGPFNLRTKAFDGKVLTSIRSDIVTLEVLSKVLSVMITCNQALVQNPLVNTYYSDDRVRDALDQDLTMASPL